MKSRSPFRMPNVVKITSRSSSITNSFVNGIIPCIKPTNEQLANALTVLEMNPDNVVCAYCGDAMTEWDHLNPLVMNKQATGFITEIQNLVPTCGKCNQSKGNRNWKEWMLSDAPNSPASRRVPDLQRRIERLENYESCFTPHRLDFEKIVGSDLWAEHWANNDAIQKMMKDSQKLSDQIRDIIANSMTATQESSQVLQRAPKHPKNTKQPKKPESPMTVDYKPKVSDLIKARIIPFLERGGCVDSEIENLQDLSYCKKTFASFYPMLKKLEAKQNASIAAKDKNGHRRYYVKPIIINGSRYLVSSQWYDNNYPLLERWLENVSHMRKDG